MKIGEKREGRVTRMGEILLEYSEKRGWYAEVGLSLITMTDATFQKHVNAYVAARGISKPTPEQLMQARGYCRRLSFWDTIHDPDVHRHVFGTQALEQKKKGK